MALPLSYNLRNLWARRLTTVLTASGMALVVFVFAAILMLAAGLGKTLVHTGSYDNVICLRKGANSEIVSGVDRQQAAVLETQPEIAVGADGQPLAAKEIVVLIALPKKGTGNKSNVILRGAGRASTALRPPVKVVEGTLPRPGSLEVMVGSSLVRRFEGLEPGGIVRAGMRDWRVTGIFDAGNTGFSSEIWGDADQFMQAFNRQAYSDVLFKLRDASLFAELKARLESDPRLTVEAKRETAFYDEQSAVMARFLRILGLSLTSIFSIGAVIGAMITMYSAVAGRTAEIGTLRALGFSRRSILAAFLVESLLLGFLGGVSGLFFASFLQL
ncbi:MAG TPA: ABC transporter permease, partial [Thermodesulfobacteriota bacterium]|nr:ABC transporter permease [Thermodesulfobacteriota bacterium]